jgi:hypothetical protein
VGTPPIIDRFLRFTNRNAAMGDCGNGIAVRWWRRKWPAASAKAMQIAI